MSENNIFAEEIKKDILNAESREGEGTIDAVAKFLSIFEPIRYEMEGENTYCYYHARHESKDIHAVIVRKCINGKSIQWYLGFIPRELREEVDGDSIAEIAEMTATFMNEDDVILRLKSALQYSRQKDLNAMKNAENSTPVEGVGADTFVNIRRAQ